MKPNSKKLLLNRRSAAALLDVSVETVKRIEAKGRLTPIKLTSGVTSPTFYKRAEVEQIANGI